jgi:hypothetical protein
MQIIEHQELVTIKEDSKNEKVILEGQIRLEAFTNLALKLTNLA